jgi:hypothetical protein
MTVVFEPQRPKRSVGAGVPVFLTLALAVVGLAVTKPWGSATSVPPADVVVADAIDTPDPPRALPPGTVELPRWEAVANAISRHDAWGLRALVDSTAPPNAASVEGRGAGLLTEAWQPLESIVRGVPAVREPVVIDAATSVRLVGLTVPEGVRIEAFRLFEARPLGRWREAPFVRLAWFRRQPALLVPSDPGNGFTLWRPGTYRVAVDVADGTTGHVLFRIEAGATASR